MKLQKKSYVWWRMNRMCFSGTEYTQAMLQNLFYQRTPFNYIRIRRFNLQNTELIYLIFYIHVSLSLHDWKFLNPNSNFTSLNTPQVLHLNLPQVSKIQEVQLEFISPHHSSLSVPNLASIPHALNLQLCKYCHNKAIEKNNDLNFKRHFVKSRNSNK